MELGLGIHGEPGARLQAMCSADEAVQQVSLVSVGRLLLGGRRGGGGGDCAFGSVQMRFRER